jgi:hypothetical protein
MRSFFFLIVRSFLCVCETFELAYIYSPPHTQERYTNPNLESSFERDISVRFEVEALIPKRQSRNYSCDTRPVLTDSHYTRWVLGRMCLEYLLSLIFLHIVACISKIISNMMDCAIILRLIRDWLPFNKRFANKNFVGIFPANPHETQLVL